VHSKLCLEIRSAAANVQDLNLDLLHSLSYLKACKDEAMRIYPPVPGILTRLVPKGGGFFCGKHVLENTVGGVNQWATYHSAANFKHPDEFRPERWLDSGEKGEYAGDRWNALQPFNYGPRKCIANE
jgi:cytochrome P450